MAEAHGDGDAPRAAAVPAIAGVGRMITRVPEGLGVVGDTEEDADRMGSISRHVYAVLRHRGLTADEQVTLLVHLAAVITATYVPDERAALRFLANLMGECFAHAQHVNRESQASALRDAPPAGSA
jgi:ADP-ribose pyrophosphatase YjhB (NUDIX family)